MPYKFNRNWIQMDGVMADILKRTPGVWVSCITLGTLRYTV